jgi:PadR family transcriptional regulator PadR
MPQRITKPTLRLLEIFLAEPRRSWYGLELMERVGMKSGTVYPILHRLKTDGWLAVELEDVDPAIAGRPVRRLYCLTGAGEINARREMERRVQLSTQALRPVPRLGGAGA